MTVVPMLKTVMTSLFGKPATVRYPFETRTVFDGSRGHIEIDIEKCVFCGACQRRCPTGAITVSKENKQWSIGQYDCVQCNNCTDVCPKKCLYMKVERPTASFKQERQTVVGTGKVETVNQDA